MRINIDLETYSAVDIKKCGMYRYMEDPTFEVLLVAYSFDGGEVRCADLAMGDRFPDDLRTALYDPANTIHGWNVIFERTGLGRLLGAKIPLEMCRDTMLSALYCGFPASLGGAGAAVGLPEDKRKMTEGKALIRYFCQPCKATKTNGGRTRNMPWDDPEKWATFKSYNIRDVETEAAIGNALAAFPVPADVQSQWVMDARINERGVAVDMDLVHGAMAIGAKASEDLTAEARMLTGLENPNSVTQLTGWLTKHGITGISKLDKETVTELLADDTITDPVVRRVLTIRQLLGKSSLKKYEAITNCACQDRHVKGLFQFYGANRSGRFAGRLVQVQNLPRNYLETLDIARQITKTGDADALGALYGNVPDTLSQLIRTAFVASDGRKFVVTDFSAIEARVLAWMAHEKWVQDVFATTGKIYEATASQMFGVPQELIAKGNPEYALRQRGKVAQLACGYQGGAAAMARMDFQHAIDPEHYPDLVQKWRAANPHIVKFWYTAQDAALNAMKYRAPFHAECVTFRHEDDGHIDYLTAELPSGRKLFYPRPFITKNRWDEDSLGFWGQNQMTKKWEQQETYGGRIVENLTQAIARDCLVVAMQRLEAAGMPIVMHIHDEVVLDVTPDRTLDEANAIMAQPIDWAPGLLLKGAGFENSYYMKD